MGVTLKNQLEAIAYSEKIDIKRNKRGVCGKVCYTQAEARNVINTAHKRRRRCKSKNIPKRIYWCEKCCAYHTTHLIFTPDGRENIVNLRKEKKEKRRMK